MITPASVRPRVVAAVALLLVSASSAAGTDHAGTWLAAGMVRAKVCTGGRCRPSRPNRFSGNLILARDGTYEIAGQPCPIAGPPLPEERGTWAAGPRGRIALTIANVAELQEGLRACLNLESLTLAPAGGWVKLGSTRGCGRAASDAREQQLCGTRRLKGRAVVRGRKGRFVSASKVTALRASRIGLCNDGAIAAGEECDDGNLREDDDCATDCTTVCKQEPIGSTWDGIRTKIFQGHQCSNISCHGGQSTVGLDLRPDAAYANLVNVASAEVPGGTRVVPGSPDTSVLWQKLAKATLGGFDDLPGSGMPIGAPLLSTNELEAVRRWIAAGAPDTGLIPDTDKLLAGCSVPPPPVEPPPAPAVTEGIRLYAPPWTIPAHGEDEVCYPTYYDVSAQVPAEYQVPCPPRWGGASKQCFYYNKTGLTQSPNSHHSIIHVYAGAHDPTDGSFGTFTCHGGTHDGTTCNPKQPGVAAPDGADCGDGAGCAGTVVSSTACVGYGPSDFAFDLAGIGGSQEAQSSIVYPDGVYSLLPVRGVMVWNSHAFNLTNRPTTNEQWFDLFFASAADRRYPAQNIFNIEHIFVQHVPPFATQEYCNTQTLPQGARVFNLGSHTHKRGALFRIWGPGMTPCNPFNGCNAEASTPLALTAQYTHPISHDFDPPLPLPSADVAARTFKYCAIYDNGATDPSHVRRSSQTPPNGYGCVDLYCVNEAKRGQRCNGQDWTCDSSKDAHDGVCDACELRGGVSTEEEMFILLGGYYCPEGSSCYTP